MGEKAPGSAARRRPPVCRCRPRSATRGVFAALDADSRYGRIRNSLKNTDSAAAGLTIRATTAYGDVTARSL